MARPIGPARRLGGLTLLVCVLVASAGAARAQEPAVPVARDATAKRIIDVALQAVAARQLESGLFRDQTGRTVGGDGLPSLAYVALARAKEDGQDPARPSGTLLRPSASTRVGAAIASAGLTTGADPDADPGSWRLTLARRTLKRGSGDTVILRWPLAMTLADDLEELLVGDRGALRARAIDWGRLHAAGIADRPRAVAADRCYHDVRCFTNYKVADQVLNLELVRSGLHGTNVHARLHDPASLRRATLHWLGTHLPPHAPPTGRVRIPGRPTATAALLSDPGTLPLAYAALCTAWTVRATRLAGRSAPAALRRLARRTLWTLLGASGPDGDVSWSGRGQGQAWTHAATVYAASAGAALFGATDPLFAARLRRLADIELTALDGRLRAGELQVLPSGNDQLSGLDHYYSVTGSTGLALAFLQMARGELPDPAALRLPIPAEIDGASFTDTTAHLVTRRAGKSWIAMRLRRDHTSDPRSDAGLVRALRLLDGHWREQLPQRPGPLPRRHGRPVATPSGGPVLVVGATHFQPQATEVAELQGGIELRGVWRPTRGGTVAGSWRYRASATGVELRSACPAGAQLEMTTWFPRRGGFRHDGGLIERAGYALRVDPRPKVRALTSPYANSVQPGLRAYRVVRTCTQPTLTATWSGGAVTPLQPPAPG